MEKYCTVRYTIAFFGFLLLNLHLTNGTVNVYQTGTPYVGQSFMITCTITSFTGTATWAQDGTIRATCGPAFCSPVTLGNYTFAYNSTAISLTIDPVSNSDQGTWKCTHSSGDDEYLLNAIVFQIILAAVLLGLGMAIGIISGCGFSSNLICHLIIQILRYLKMKKYKYHVPEYTLEHSVGETAILEIDSTLVLAYQADSRNISSNESDTKVIFSINIDSVVKYGVYHIDILIEDWEDKDKIKVRNYGTAETTPADDHGGRKPIDDFLLDDKPSKGGLIKFQLQFHPNNGDFVTIKNSDEYIFTDKYTMCGMTFKSIQIIIAAALNQLVTIVPTVIVLAVVYCYYREFDIAIVAAVVVASAVVCPILNIIVYILTVLCCCRKMKFKRENEDKSTARFRTLRTALLIMMHILPVAWFVLIVIIIVKKCRENCHNEEQNTENHGMDTPYRKT